MLSRHSALFLAFVTAGLLLLSFASVKRAYGEPQMSWPQLNQQMALRPKDANLWCMRGEILAKTFEDKEAIECYTKAIELDPKLARAYLHRGNAYLTFERTQDALKDYQTAQTLLKGKPDVEGYFDVQFSLANCYKNLKQYSVELPRRIEVLKKTGSANDWAFLAECQMRNGMLKEASNSYQSAIKVNPRQIDLHRKYGEYFLKIGDYAKAEQEFSRAIDLAVAEHAQDISSNYHMFELRADCYDKLGRTALAVQDRRRAQHWQESIFDVIPVQVPRNK